MPKDSTKIGSPELPLQKPSWACDLVITKHDRISPNIRFLVIMIALALVVVFLILKTMVRLYYKNDLIKDIFIR